ncbi:MAG: Bug family tripartite tricarboxylate transporter substrate binding protein [Limnohabitans sp.]|jgi:tripartite-type tricarboxylate transporter receptor subunit TctC
MKRRQWLQAAAASTAWPTLWQPAQAQDSAPIRILCGFPPGGLTDLVARLFADKLRAELNQPVVVENKPGAGGRLAALALKAAAPDGRTLLIAPNSMPVFTEILYPRKTLDYDMLSDWTPVGTLCTYPFGMVVQRSLGVANVREYIARVKAQPKDAMVGNAGAGGQAHFASVQLGMAAGLELLAVPYKGNGPLSVDLIGGQVPAAVLPAADLMQHRANPKLQILGVFENERSPLIPDVPTFAEQGLKFEVGRAWMGMWAPARAPRAEVARVEAGLRNILRDPAFRETLQTRFTMAPMWSSAADTDRLQRQELALWRPIIQATGFRPES